MTTKHPDEHLKVDAIASVARIYLETNAADNGIREIASAVAKASKFLFDVRDQRRYDYDRKVVGNWECKAMLQLAGFIQD